MKDPNIRLKDLSNQDRRLDNNSWLNKFMTRLKQEKIYDPELDGKDEENKDILIATGRLKDKVIDENGEIREVDFNPSVIERAKSRIVGSKGQLVYKIARRMGRNTEEIQDLMQVGLMAIWEACLSYDPYMDVRFNTYAITCAIGKMNNFLHREIEGYRVSDEGLETSDEPDTPIGRGYMAGRSRVADMISEAIIKALRTRRML